MKRNLVGGVAFAFLLVLSAVGCSSDIETAAETSTAEDMPTTTTTTTTDASTSTATTEAAEVAITAASSSDVEETIAYKLAVVDEGGYVSPDDEKVILYGGALKRAAENCPADGEEGVADMAVVASQILARDFGIDVSAFDMVQGLNTALSGMSPQDDCADEMSALLILIAEA